MAVILSSLRRRKSFPLFVQLLRLRCFSDSLSLSCPAPAHGTVSPDSHFMVQYLVKSCGFSAAEATKAAKPFAHLRSSEKPDAVLSFLRSHGFLDAHLRKIITEAPRCLCFRVERTLAPKLEALRSWGFSESDITGVLVAQPRLMFHNFRRSILPRLEMWESLFGSRELLLKHHKRHTWLLSFSIENKFRPNMEFLTDECKIPKERIALAVRKNPAFLAKEPDALRALAARVNEMGVPRESKMFLWIVYVLCMVSKDKFETLFKTVRKFGWSDDEFYTAIKRQPTLLCLSKELLQKRLEFFVNDVGCLPSYIAKRPKMMLFSMDKRVLPRLRAMEVLKAKGLWNGQVNLQVSYLLSLTDAIFFRRFVLPSKE